MFVIERFEVFLYIFEKCKIQFAILQYYKIAAKKNHFSDFLKYCSILLGDRRNIIFSLFGEPLVNFVNKIIWMILPKKGKSYNNNLQIKNN